jgi:rhodanese-related sulfurtransferase
MFEMLKQLLGIGPKVDIAALIAKGAVIVDVRTPGEFASGHVKGSLNIPLDSLRNRLKELPANKPIITCCASGMRSGTAKSIMLSSGFEEVHNAGSWTSLQ